MCPSAPSPGRCACWKRCATRSSRSRTWREACGSTGAGAAHGGGHDRRRLRRQPRDRPAVLRRHRFPATIFLVSRRFGGKNDWNREGAVAGGPCSAEQAVRMRQRGDTSAPTPAPTALCPTQTTPRGEEIGGSRSDLEALLASRCRPSPTPTASSTSGTSRSLPRAAIRRLHGRAGRPARRRPAADSPGRDHGLRLPALPPQALVRRALKSAAWRGRRQPPQVFAEADPEGVGWPVSCRSGRAPWQVQRPPGSRSSPGRRCRGGRPSSYRGRCSGGCSRSRPARR